MVVVAPEEDPKLAKLVDHVVRVMEPLEVWLFGSPADGRARLDSDYDILVIVPDAALDAWRGEGRDRHASARPPPVECDSMPREERILAFLGMAREDLDAAVVLARTGNHYAAYHVNQATEKVVKALLYMPVWKRAASTAWMAGFGRGSGPVRLPWAAIDQRRPARRGRQSLVGRLRRTVMPVAPPRRS
jgi:hypothetical protein